MKTKSPVRVLLLCPYPLGISPSQRFRFEQYLDGLRRSGLEIDVHPFLDNGTMSVLYKPGFMLRRIWGVLKGFLRRLVLMPKMNGYDYVYIHREASPLGPPFVEAYLFIFGKKVIYDFDDAIFIAKTSEVNRIIGFAKWSSKVRFITKNSYKVAVCNNYLVDWVRQYNDNAVLIPTTIDLEYHKPLRKRPIEGRTPVIGWTGSRSTMKYLDLVREALVQIQKNYRFEFRVICDVDPGFAELNNYCFIKWNFDTEIADLSEIDVGLMPVPMGDWEKGKVGFKAIQYSGVSAVPVVSSTGSGNEVVVHGITGLVIENTTESWVNALSSLLNDQKKIEMMGVSAREYIDKCYSVRSQALSYRSLFA